MFSFGDIVREAEARRGLAKKNIASWDRLLSVASELSGRPASESEILSDEKVWNLERISIHHFRGVANDDPLVVSFEPTPGITVLHGLNGAGKSSVSDAIEFGLSGKPSEASSATGGKSPLWDPVHLARGSQSAHVSVTLTSGTARLVLDASLDSSGAIQSHTATIKDAEGERQAPLDSSWRAALLSHQPVFAYASLERRVQLSKDLAEYFEGLLALGGSFTALHDEIVLRSGASTEALQRWNVARSSAMQLLEEIDSARTSESSPPALSPVREPQIGEDMQEWIESAGLLEGGQEYSTLPGDTHGQLADCAHKLLDSIRALEAARGTSELLLSAGLEQLHNEARYHRIGGDTCPVCLEVAPDWLKKLRSTVEKNQSIANQKKSVNACTKALTDLAGALLDPILEVTDGAIVDSELLPRASTLRHLVESFRESREDGVSSNFEVMLASSNLANWIISDGAKSLIGEAIERTDSLKQWAIARSRVASSFIEVWKSDGPAAMDATAWKETTKRLDDLRKHLRGRRSVTLERRSSDRIEKLLADANLRLKGINVLSTKASMELVDEHDKVVDLGMLSAGQRNAVLLAPLLACIDSGPFGFIILDDPVHAFDELRIDRLASTLAELALTRRVIVLTHDERLKEHLVARTLEYDTRMVDRTSSSGEVQISDSSQFWDELLTDARSILDLAMDESGSLIEVTDAVRKLCRMSIDNALRSFALRNASSLGRDVILDLDRLDSCDRTDQRLKVAEDFWEGPIRRNPVTLSIRKCSEHFEAWNHSIHGNPAITVVTVDEIKNARAACKQLSRAA
ncbi:AAA family ATPase [Brachybacterium sp. AOP3-A1-3]|uniref:AAA family ATPase n=1 Tax=Brachybacterium sp. AOP3-A1-3 TaxID=3457699 RepID=UPI0040338D79